MKTAVTILILLTAFSLNTLAQDFDYTTLEGHTDDVKSVAFSPDGRTLASGADFTVYLWDVGTGKSIATLEGHTDDVESVSFSPDGQTLASSAGFTVYLWDVGTGKSIATLEGHTGYVKNVSFFPDAQTLASGGDVTVRLWDAETGRHLRTLGGYNTGTIYSVSFSPDGRTFASAVSDRIIRLWDVETGKVIRELIRHKNTVLRHEDTAWSVAFSPDGKTLASGYEDDTISLWDAETGRHLRTLRGHEWRVINVVFSPDGKKLASTSWDQTARLWDTETGRHLRTLRGVQRDSSVAFSPDGTTLASASSDNTVRLWKLPNTHISIMPDPVLSPIVGERFTIDVNIVEGENIGGYQVSFWFDSIALRYVDSSYGDYLPPGAFFVPPTARVSPGITRGIVQLGATSLAGVGKGDGTLATVTFEVVEVKKSLIAIDKMILTDSTGERLPHLASGAEVEPSLVPSSAVVRLTPTSVLSPAVGEQLTFNVDITGGQNVTDFQLTFDYDRSALTLVSENRGNYLVDGVGNGDGTLQIVTFEVRNVKTSTVSVSGYLIAPNGLRSVPTFESAEIIVPLLGDVNRDGVVNILDLVKVASKFGQSVSGDPADVNEDGVVNIVDLVKVAGALGDGAAAPSAWHLSPEVIPTRTNVQQWLSQAQQLNLADATSQRGILFLENLLGALTPKETTLLPNYPNPFNPETWIPYQLAAPADVHISIYTADGKLVRTLDLGHQPIGIYQDKSRAAYWDGRNQLGEPVASAVYFYTLKAGDFTATQKMLIRK